MEKQISMEEWKNIYGYEEYQVSTLGRVKRLAYYKNVCGGGKQYCEERILKLQKRKGGYQAIVLSKNSKAKSFLVHRLVAMAFIPNPENLPQVNHKDENPSNNCVDNLEWCNQRYNSNYGTSKYRISAKLKNGILSKPVEQYCKNGMFIMEYPSAIEASRVLGLNVSGIVLCCNNNPKYSHCGGYQWKYKGSEKQINNIVNKIAQITKDGKIINIFESATQASNTTGISRTAIANNLSHLSKSAGGFIWKKI
jgi:hypothetical protein